MQVGPKPGGLFILQFAEEWKRNEAEKEEISHVIPLLFVFCKSQFSRLILIAHIGNIFRYVCIRSKVAKVKKLIEEFLCPRL